MYSTSMHKVTAWNYIRNTAVNWAKTCIALIYSGFLMICIRGYDLVYTRFAQGLFIQSYITGRQALGIPKSAKRTKKPPRTNKKKKKKTGTNGRAFTLAPTSSPTRSCSILQDQCLPFCAPLLGFPPPGNSRQVLLGHSYDCPYWAMSAGPPK